MELVQENPECYGGYRIGNTVIVIVLLKFFYSYSSFRIGNVYEKQKSLINSDFRKTTCLQNVTES